MYGIKAALSPPIAMTAATAWKLALAMLLVPPLFGTLTGHMIRRCCAPRLWVKLLITAVLGLAPFVFAAALPQFSIYDVIAIAWLFAGGCFCGMRPMAQPFSKLGVFVSVLVTALGLGGVECLMRLHPMPFANRFILRYIHLRFSPLDRDQPCLAMFPDDFPDSPPFRRTRSARALPRRPGVRRILHVGDSMTEGTDVPEEATFVALLNRRRPGEEHLNLGISSTGTDVHLLVVRRWIERLSPDEIVLHVFPGNDVAEMNRPYVCCGDGSLFRREGADLVEVCPRAILRVSYGRLLRQGPSPFPLRVLASRSELARRLAYNFERYTATHVPGDILLSQPHNLDDFGAAISSLREEAARASVLLTVVVMPNRLGWDGTVPMRQAAEAATHLAILGRLRQAGVRFVDAWPDFEARWRRDPAEPVYQSETYNSHFRQAGHRLYADWVESHVW